MKIILERVESEYENCEACIFSEQQTRACTFAGSGGMFECVEDGKFYKWVEAEKTDKNIKLKQSLIGGKDIS